MATTAPLAYKASQPYVQNRLDAPRYIVPPPNLDYQGGKPVFTLINAAPHADVSSEFGNPYLHSGSRKPRSLSREASRVRVEV